jgi:choline dehydrogenase-like flavoprotein
VTTLSCDVLVIGSGAAGGVLAATIAERTPLSVVLVEKGGYYGAEFFNQREWDMRVLYAGRPGRSTADGAIPVRGGECVGGGTTVNLAFCFDPVRPVWERWSRERGLTGFSFDPSASDYGVAGLSLASATDEVRRRISVHRATDDDVNDNNRRFAEGCRALGIEARHFELNTRDCLRCGYCAEGCAYDRKRGTMVTYIADALERGVQLVHHCTIDRLMIARRGDSQVVTGVGGRVRSTQPGSRPNAVPPGDLEIRARVVIVSAGAVETPALLQRSGHPDPHGVIGRGLILHPSLPVAGLFAEELVNYRGVPGTMYSEAFAESHGFLLECAFGHPVYGSAILPGFGADHFTRMLEYRRAAGFGVMLVDTVDPMNRVEWDPRQERARIHYRLTESDKARLRFGARRAVEIMFAAGAREVFLPSDEPIGPLRAPHFTDPAEAEHCAALRFLPHATTITSSHCQATVKMGEDPGNAVVNSRGESHRVRNLLVCDSSVFPTSCGANPMLSIMAMARYQGRRLAAEWARHDT